MIARSSVVYVLCTSAAQEVANYNGAWKASYARKVREFESQIEKLKRLMGDKLLDNAPQKDLPSKIW